MPQPLAVAAAGHAHVRQAWPGYNQVSPGASKGGREVQPVHGWPYSGSPGSAGSHVLGSLPFPLVSLLGWWLAPCPSNSRASAVHRGQERESEALCPHVRIGSCFDTTENK